MSGTRTTAAVLAVITTLALPFWALAVRASSSRWRGRLGVDVPPVAPGAVWIHGASLGEIGGSEALIPHLDGPILLTADTASGARLAEELASRVGPRAVGGSRPIDHPWTLAPLWADARPRAIVFLEGAFWPQLAAMAAAAGVPVVRVSGRIGDRSWRLGRLWGWVTDAVGTVGARDEGMAARFRAIGAPDVRVTGDLKGDRPVPPPALTFERPYLVGASTRPGDEAALLRLLDRFPDHALVLAPRHAARFDEVFRSVRDIAVLRSELDGRVPRERRLIVLDRQGELAGLVGAADAAFVGGTFDPAIGGHSPREAANAGTPIVAGPHRQSNDWDGVVLDEAPTREEIPAAFAKALTRRRVPSRNGAGARTAEIVRSILGPWAPEACPRPWARPVAPLWMAIAGVRRRVQATRAPVPVWSVGSTNARAPGKTSIARAIAAILAGRGERVGVALRGYGRVIPGDDVRLSTDRGHVLDLGDEAMLFVGDGHLVASGPDRVEAARRLADAGATVIVLDDGGLSTRLHRDRDLWVVDARFPAARGPMPAGERRLCEIVPEGAHGILVTHGEPPPGLPDVPTVKVALEPTPWRRGDGEGAPVGPVALVAGVGRVADVLAGMDRPVAKWQVLPDHLDIDHELAARLRDWAGGLPIATTAKDFVRWPKGKRRRIFWRDRRAILASFPW